MTPRPYIKSISFIEPKSKTTQQVESIDWSVFPFNIPAINDLDKIEFHPDVTFLVGENGSGKSTVLEAIALALGFGQEGGTKNVQISTKSTDTGLAKHLRLIKSYQKPKDAYFLRAESFYNVASYMDEVGYLGGYGGKSLHVCSHGESFMAVLLNKLKGNGLYLFDEPESALSPTRQLSALVAINDLVQADSQFIIATHSPILLTYPNAKILQFSDTGITEVNYEQTEHYSVTKNFLNNPDAWLNQLFTEWWVIFVV